MQAFVAGAFLVDCTLGFLEIKTGVLILEHNGDDAVLHLRVANSLCIVVLHADYSDLCLVEFNKLLAHRPSNNANILRQMVASNRTAYQDCFDGYDFEL